MDKYQMVGNYQTAAAAGAIAGAFVVWMIVGVIFAVLNIIAMWKIFAKAGEAGWKSLIPIYNLYVLFKITWGNGWLFLLMLVPIVNGIIMLILLVKLAKVFGQGGGFACGLIFLQPIFILLLGFGRYEYVGIEGKEVVE